VSLAQPGNVRPPVLAAGIVLLLCCSYSQAQQANPQSQPPNPAPAAPSSTAAPAPPSSPPAPPSSVPPAASPKATKPATATPIDIKKAELGEQHLWNPDWDLIVENALPPSLLTSQVPHDVRRFCPRFYRMSDPDKRAFWAYFFQALAGAEAGLNPTSHVRHVGALIARDPVTHLPVHSEGLLQLSYQDSRRYGCNFDWDTDRQLKPGNPDRTILQPKNNLECGVTILTRQIIDNHKPIFWKLSYWSTLRPGTISYRVFARQMVSPPPACGYPSRTHRILDRMLFMRRLVADR
jgi:hypothetical protein